MAVLGSSQLARSNPRVLASYAVHTQLSVIEEELSWLRETTAAERETNRICSASRGRDEARRRDARADLPA
jgi:hypothetical protein